MEGSITKANGYLHQLESLSFLIAFKVLLEAMVSLRGLKLKLQMEAGDVLYAYREVQEIISYLKTIRSRSEAEFSQIFAEAAKLEKDLHGEDFELRMPRVNRRQVHCSNVDVSRAKDYFCITIYNEFLSHTISELQSRFLDNPGYVVGRLHLLPSECCQNEDPDMSVLEVHSGFLQKMIFPVLGYFL